MIAVSLFEPIDRLVASESMMLIKTNGVRLAVAVLALVLSVSLGVNCQDTDKATITGTVIGTEQPDLFGWPMHTNRMDILYVRVEKVLKGKMTSRYIRLGYPYNEGRGPKLSEEILDGKHIWRFDVASFDEWSSTVIVSREDGDWWGKPYADPENKNKPLEEQFEIVPITQKCVPIKGFEAEAITLEQRGVIKGYFLRYGKKGPQKVN